MFTYICYNVINPVGDSISDPTPTERWAVPLTLDLVELREFGNDGQVYLLTCPEMICNRHANVACFLDKK